MILEKKYAKISICIKPKCIICTIKIEPYNIKEKEDKKSKKAPELKCAIAQCKMNNEKCKIKEETPLGVSKINIFSVIRFELHQ